ncbi:phosphotransferase [Pyxidicoccus sp. MSG2]|uniref:phosphotransferase n=1 Tax=Pyxidicoccus sp. MSG2 TaxID=2996790 RepID=UPI00226ED702|nr:phosphotransferase [Pyxidicoccus sp. MSG2]MCY1022742.1 phosphotransferase [Pyxidicoccus sp. MSG2]
MKRGGTLAELWSHGLGLAIESVRVNSVRLETRRDVTVWVKRRRLGMGAVIATGNVFLRLSRSRIRMFVSCSRWRDWELDSFRLLHAGRVAERWKGCGVALEALPGERLDLLLARGQLTPPMVEAAAHELRRAHGLTFPGSSRPWSHGDAHLKNVLYDAGEQRAWLIDFETPHEARLPAGDRHADDLFVFLLDLVGRAPEGPVEGLAAAFLRAYAREDVLRALLARLQPPRGLERALWKSRSQQLPEARLLRWLEHLRNEVLGLIRP